MLDVKYKELGGLGLVTTPLNMAPNLSECNVSHAGIAQLLNFNFVIISTVLWLSYKLSEYFIYIFIITSLKSCRIHGSGSRHIKNY